ncbi:MAG TPA: TrkH family potassium uptake protein [Halanaerobiales bacterium]|nr:TrkH family potassium uptake protein [Halanaerobiales bacterium]
MALKESIKLYKLSPAQILVAGYFTVILTGTILLSLPMATTATGSLGFIDSLFTSTSATCVTGLIVVNTSSAFTVFGQVVIMLLIQIGGLGIMSMSTLMAFLIGKKISLKERLVIQQDLNQFGISGLVRLIQYVLGFTLIIEGAGAIFMFTKLIHEYKIVKAIYYSIFHAVSAFNNAGFDLFGNSLVGFTGSIIMNFAVMILIILGGIGFGVLTESTNDKRFGKSSLQSKIVVIMTLILLVVGFLVLLALEFNNPETMGKLPFGEKILSAMFLSVTPRTAGFNTLPTNALRSSSLFFIIILMFIGASPGSTGGGIKTTTFGIMVITMWNKIIGKKDIEIYNRRIDEEDVLKAMAITLLAMALIVLITIVLTITESKPFLDILFETVSAFGTVGLSTGVTPTLSKIGRILIIMTMFAGRVGPLTLAVAFAERQRKGIYHYPKEKIMVG